MKQIVAATDLSERSDRAIRRAILLARQFGGEITLVHVIDDDRPAALVQSEQAKATELVEQQGRSVADIDGVTCTSRVILGDPPAGISLAVQQIDPDLVVFGPHRRSPVKDAFVGTTGERTIRQSRVPVLIPNGIPAGYYRTVLIATDLSVSSKSAITVTRALGFDRLCKTALIHAAETSEMELRSKAWYSQKEQEAAVASEMEAARAALDDFLADSPCILSNIYVERCADRKPADVVLAKAAETRADLVVLGTHGRSAASRMLLGSVAEEILRLATADVLVVPGRATAR